MRSFLIILTSFMVFLIGRSDIAVAGIFELSASGSYKNTNFDATHSAASESGTAGLAYYFWDLSALEIAYTRGDANQVQPEYIAYQTYTAYGVDLLVTVANQDSILKPYLKAGAAYLFKSLRYSIPGFTQITVDTQGIAPTAGMGFKLMLGQRFAIKGGVDVSSSPINIEPVTYDFGATGGISILF
jgi:hypothetical protein